MRFLVTTDRSEHSLRVFPHVAALARAAGAELSLLQVLDPRMDAANELDVSLAAACERVAARWKTELEALVRARGLDASVQVAIKGQRESLPDTVVRVAGELEAVLIAMDTRGANRLRHALVGSVASGVVGQSRPPVLLTRAGMREPAAGATYRLLVTNDGSTAALDVIAALRPVLAQLKPDVVLVRAHELPAGDSANIEEELHAVAAQFPVDVPVTLRVVPLGGRRTASDAILALADEAGADSIAMSTQGHSARRHLVAGSVALDVLGRAPIPVILARRG